MRILIIEDDRKIAGFIREGLSSEGYAVEVRTDGRAGFEAARRPVWDLIVLDLMLPEMDGMAVLQRLREAGESVPVLILTARDSVDDRVAGLNTGADDYLCKPFSYEELLARIRALLRRSGQTPGEVLRAADLTINPLTREVRRSGRKIELTAREYALLEYLVRRRGIVLSRTMIAERVWGYQFDLETNVIDVFINRLRKKIDAAFSPKLLHTVRGAGYVLRG